MDGQTLSQRKCCVILGYTEQEELEPQEKTIYVSNPSEKTDTDPTW